MSFQNEEVSLTPHLQWTQLELLDYDDCREAFTKVVANTTAKDIQLDIHRHICTAPQNGGTCFGKSGGILMQPTPGRSANKKLFQVGIVSDGFPYCLDGAPTKHTAVLPYIDWIKNKLTP